MPRHLTFLIILFILLAFQFNLAAGDAFKLDKARMSAGKGSVTSGLDVSLFFSKDSSSNSFSFTGNHERVYSIYAWQVPLRIRVGISGGFFKNTPWLGPKVNISLFKFLELEFWQGWSAGRIPNPSFSVKNNFTSYAAYFKFGNLSLMHTSLNFQLFDRMHHISGFEYSRALNSNFNWTLGFEYDFQDEEPLYRIAVEYRPDKKPL